MKIEHKIFDAEVKAFDDENLIVEHFISTEHKDRGGDIMRAKGMKIIGKPVVLMLHGRGPMSSEPIAKPLSITVDEFKGQPGILAKTQFFPDEVGTRLYQKIKGGFIPNWSIGYAVDEAKDIMESGRFAGRDVTKWQLLEYSPIGVPMNPFAQTIKDFLFDVEAGTTPETPKNPKWFGLVEEKSCTHCGACGGKPGECPTCKGPLTHFAKGEDLLGSACEKCQPEEFAELSKAIHPFQIEEKPYPNEHACRVMDPAKCKRIRRQNNKFGEGIHALWGVMEDDSVKLQAIRFDSSKFTADAAKKWAEDHDYKCVPFEPATGKEEEIPEAEPELLKQIETQEKILTIEVKIEGLTESMAVLNDTLKKLEPLLKTLPPDPDGGEKGEEEHPDNPPEKKTPPRLVIVRDEETSEAEKQAAKARILAIAREVINEAARQEIDRMKGRVP